jgi:hypothetical protein
MRAARSCPPEFTAPRARESKSGDGMGELPALARAKAGNEHGTAWVVAQRGPRKQVPGDPPTQEMHPKGAWA